MNWPWASRKQVESLQSQVLSLAGRVNSVLDTLEVLLELGSAIREESAKSAEDIKETVTKASGVVVVALGEHAEASCKDHSAIADAIVDLPEKFPVPKDAPAPKELPSAEELARVYRGAHDDLLNEVSTLRIKVAELQGTVKIAEQRASEADKAAMALKNWIHVTHRLDQTVIPGTIKQLFSTPPTPQ